MIQSLLFSIAPVVGMIAGGVAAVIWQPSSRVRSYVQHFAAGVVFAAVGVEILPDVMHRKNPLAAAGGFAVGVAAMLAIRAMSRRAESQKPSGVHGIRWALLAAVAIDVFVDGMLIGVGFAAGQRQGILLAVAMTGCAVSLGLATAATQVREQDSPSRALAFTAGLALLPAIGAACGALLGNQLSGGWMEAVLSFTCAALLYLITEELLREAHEAQEKPETPLTTTMFFAGFLALLITDMMV